jgi:predicted O-methyltransferase YrrM
MLESEELSAALHAIMTGFPDRARNLIATSANLDEDEREIFWKTMTDSSNDTELLEALGDALRIAHAEKTLVNEAYRASFYGSDAWQTLVDDPLFAYFSANKAGLVLDKWIHYFPIYTRHLSPYAGQPVSVLEIGVYRGGSMRMWSRFFGPAARLVGVDVDPIAVVSAGERYTVVIADQADPDAIRRVADEHGPFDVIIDDGGHTMDQQITSVEALFPMLNEGGVYLVEDCHTSYWDEYGGGLGREGTFMEWVKTRLDDLNGYHMTDAVDPVWTKQVDGFHIYDSVVILDKKTRFPPFAEHNGGAEFVFTSRMHSVIASELVATRQAALEERDQAVSGDHELGILRDELRITRAELRTVMPRLATAEAELDDTRNQLLDSWQHVREMRQTMSWRVTGPLRRLRRWR